MAGMILDQLRRAETAFEKADRTREQKRELRNKLVRVARADGATYHQISEATGLSRGRISQIMSGDTKAR